MDPAKNAPGLFPGAHPRATLVWFGSISILKGILVVGSLLITFLLLGSFVGAALMIRYINTRTAHGVPARARTRATVEC
ncbi:hypothetical protein OPAG_06767 [Rhodococcus opacus PD630]|uniref:hypothetical protein n=1 Tax=Rhodococcus opacus TaxID=37919 RepID=UPI00029CBC92|nr:hypothetical protein [Rhodococcus opacus]AHK35936.1 hypothetical protein Pd630_LPD15026 [Rhodococcus opacus PD630]EHI43489.1 hypothetical protein OPAG_06767 [Rhodococcus opacus PD630]UDH01348.1 hypothetical protein K2Z90_007846 [Rhodococcus opacus PD630]